MENFIVKSFKDGIEAHVKGNEDVAKYNYKKILEKDLNHSDANHNLAIILLKNGNLQESVPFFKRALEANPAITKFWISYINILIKLNKKKEAEKVLLLARQKGETGKEFDNIEKALSQMHDDTDSQKIKLKTLEDELRKLLKPYSENKFQEVINQCKVLLIRFPNSFQIYNLLGSCFASLNLYSKAIEYYEKAVDINSKISSIYINLGKTCNHINDNEKALINYKKAIDLDPNNASVHNSIGIILLIYKDYSSSIKHLNKAIELKSDFADPYYNLGMLYQETSNYNYAKEHYKKALKINSNYFKAYNNLGNIYLDEKKLKKSHYYYKKALSIEPDYYDAKQNIANLYFKLKKYSKSKAIFDKFDDRKSIAQSLECLYQSENITQFNIDVKKITEKDPTNIRVAAISAFAANQFNQKDFYPFCKNPHEFFHISNLKNHLSNPSMIIEKLINEININKLIWEPKRNSTKNGFQTVDNLFKDNSEILSNLKKIINKEIMIFYEKFRSNENILFKEWPEQLTINAWFVRLIKGGHQNAHIHPDGWVSGVIYLKTILNPINNEGALQLSLHGYDYKIKNKNYPKVLHQPNLGDIVLFPSSLFHETIPVTQDAERCVIAFDMIPNFTKK